MQKPATIVTCNLKVRIVLMITIQKRALFYSLPYTYRGPVFSWLAALYSIVCFVAGNCGESVYIYVS